MARGFGWLKGWRRVATRYDKYAHRFLGFLYFGGYLDLAEAKYPHGHNPAFPARGPVPATSTAGGVDWDHCRSCASPAPSSRLDRGAFNVVVSVRPV